MVPTANLNIKNFSGDIPQIDTLATLVQHDANINALNGNGDTWLHEAMEEGYNLEFVGFLLSLGASPRTKNIGGYTPFEYAMKTNTLMALKTIIKYQQSGVQSHFVRTTTQTKDTSRNRYLPLICFVLAWTLFVLLPKFLNIKVAKQDNSCSNHIVQCVPTDHDFNAKTYFSKETFLKDFYCDQYANNHDFNFWVGYYIAAFSSIAFFVIYQSNRKFIS